MTFDNELKPPLEEAMWHYGVMGMKWGVRKDRLTGAAKKVANAQKRTANAAYRAPGKAARATYNAQRRTAESIARAPGKARASYKDGKPTSAEIKKARKSVLSKRAQEQKNAASVKDKVSIALLGEYSKSLSDNYRANPERAIAYRMTLGEKAVQALLAVPTVGTGLAINIALAKGVARDQKKAAAGNK